MIKCPVCKKDLKQHAMRISAIIAIGTLTTFVLYLGVTGKIG